MKDTTTHIRFRLDRFIGEIEGERNSRAHLISILGGDSDIGAIGAAIHEQSFFTMRGPGIDPLTATLGDLNEFVRHIDAPLVAPAGLEPLLELLAGILVQHVYI